MTRDRRQTLRPGRLSNRLQNFVCTCVILVFAQCSTAQADGDGTIDYCLDLHAGSNLISFYALPEDKTISNVMAPLLGNVTDVIGEGVAATYQEDRGWMGSLTTINPRSGYWVKLNEMASLCLSEAIPTAPGTQYDLHTGNNLVSFPYHGSVDIGDALPDDIENAITDIIGEGIAALNSDDRGWIGSLTAFEGGKGYWVKTTEPVVFAFDVPEPSGLLLLVGLGTAVFVFSRNFLVR